MIVPEILPEDEHDEQGRLISITTCGPTVSLATYTFDANNELISKSESGEEQGGWEREGG